jgi:predicted MPP superfamily phosphohydrolase
VLALSFGVQVPALLALVRVTGHAALPLALAAALSFPFVARLLRNPWEHRPSSRLHLYVGMWPFYVWWTVCLVFLVLGPAALVVSSSGAVSFDAALAGALGASAACGAWALRRTPRITRRHVAIAGLPRELEGFRIVQLTDVHCGPFTPAARVRRWVRRANALRADLAAVTGDLITSGADYVASVASALGELRAAHGTYACMGNHDYFTDGEEVVRALERQGLQVLRNRGVVLRPRDEHAGAALYVAGIDDTWTRRHDLARALRDRPVGAPVVLLAHDPDVFPEAAAAGVALTVAGHTHGGQLAVPGLTRRANLARLMTRFSSGVYRAGDATLFVGLGLGTSGPPIRIGARPEIALLTLVAAPRAADAAMPTASSAHRHAAGERR